MSDTPCLSDHSFATSDIISEFEEREWVDVPKNPIKLINKGTIYGKILVDVDGCVLHDKDGNLLTLYSRALRTAMEEGKIRCIHALYPGYRYFVRSQWQYDRFVQDREFGVEDPNRCYCIYTDDDFSVDLTPNSHKVVYKHQRRQ